MSPFGHVPDGIRVAVRLTPKASRSRIDGIVEDETGAAMLKVSVTAVPEDGKANRALIALLSKEWRMAKSLISVIQGATDRRKVLHVSGDPQQIGPRLDQWLEGLSDERR